MPDCTDAACIYQDQRAEHRRYGSRGDCRDSQCFTNLYSSPHDVITPSPGFIRALPEISRFDRNDQTDGEAYQDWIEQFESIASLARWDDHCKLVNLTTRLRGAAYSFYRSCTPEQRSDYNLLLNELGKRFTPVTLPEVQSQLFHERRQGRKETADEFAQYLRRLFARAYAGVNRGGPEAEKMGQSVLANQFITGLRPELKGKIVGAEGTLDQLLCKVRFEEAKEKEFTAVNPYPKPVGTRTFTPRSTQPPTKLPPSGENRTCYNCGMTGHLSRQCPYPRQPRKDKEASGRTISNVRSGDQSLQEKVTELKRELYMQPRSNWLPKRWLKTFARYLQRIT